MMRRTAGKRIGKRGRGNTISSANSEVCSTIDKLSDLYQVVEDGGIDGARKRHVIVRIRKGLKHFERQLKPWSVKGGDIAPMPTRQRKRIA